MEVLKVSSRSNPNSVAGAMAGVIRQAGAVEVQVVGAGALNQAVKAIAIARGYVAPSNIDLVCIPTFADIEIDGESRTAIRLTIEDRTHRAPEPMAEGGRAIDVTEPAPAPASAAAPATAPAAAPATAAAPAATPVSASAFLS
ncbi:MAG: Stage sporulation protein [Acidimicrobiales bacterium]|nr:Stage sporulation protein [Acidimicrobiales bacterium]